jgi:hypothetical protein
MNLERFYEHQDENPQTEIEDLKAEVVVLKEKLEQLQNSYELALFDMARMRQLFRS